MLQTRQVKGCPVCAGSFQDLYPVRDTNQGVAGQWMIERCEGCGLGRLRPFPSLDDIESFYRGVFYTPQGQRFRPWAEAIRLWLSGFRGTILNRLCAAKGKLLDFGGGPGHFAAAMRQQGWNAATHDPYGRSDAVDLAPGSYDAVTLWAVIEHVPDPARTIAEMCALLKPGGALVLMTQNFASVQARVFKSRWLYLDPPRHLYQFDPGTLTRLAEAQGLRVVRTSHASMVEGTFVILQSALNVLLGNRNGLFQFLKNRGVAKSGVPLAEIVLGTALLPFAVVAYFGLQAVRSGDVFTLYLLKR